MPQNQQYYSILLIPKLENHALIGNIVASTVFEHHKYKYTCINFSPLELLMNYLIKHK